MVSVTTDSGLAPNPRFGFWPRPWPMSPPALLRCERFRLSGNHRGIRAGALNFGAALMIVWSGEGNCAWSSAKPLTGAVDETTPVCAAGLGKARRRAEFSKNGEYGQLSIYCDLCQGGRREFFPDGADRGRPGRRKWLQAWGSGSRENGGVRGKIAAAVRKSEKTGRCTKGR